MGRVCSMPNCRNRRQESSTSARDLRWPSARRAALARRRRDRVGYVAPPGHAPQDQGEDQARRQEDQSLEPALPAKPALDGRQPDLAKRNRSLPGTLDFQWDLHGDFGPGTDPPVQCRRPEAGGTGLRTCCRGDRLPPRSRRSTIARSSSSHAAPRSDLKQTATGGRPPVRLLILRHARDCVRRFVLGERSERNLRNLLE